ncbi:MAG TPA: hypothetical protein VGZ27_14780 [Vicinamibacterales bacterium]|jgi:hypothetical protein|nr:hypothetical protein [Vicinamibacterales bacterium]
MDRREFLTGSMGAAVLAALPADAFAQQGAAPQSHSWDAGLVRHLLPTVSDTRILIKASFNQPLVGTPSLRIGGTVVRGRMNDTRGECWQFYATGLQPGRRHTLSLVAANRKPLCESWDLSTFPPPGARPESFRVLFFTCAGGPDNDLTRGYLPTAIRNRLMRRALSFQPQAMIANGDHVYWDLHSPRVAPARRDNSKLQSFDRSALVFGDNNETVLKLAAGPQIVPVYGTDFRSTPVFFLQDDHDYFDNDEAFDEIVTFPPVWFQLELARATQRLYYPEFLPDDNRPLGLPWGSVGGRADGVSESWGTLRFGNLVEILLYDVRRTCTLAGPSAVFIDPEVERWLVGRTTSQDVTHLVHAPSNPLGWTAGKWMEWYPDVLNADGKLTIAEAKPYWQSGWLKQHDRLVAAMAAMKGRIPLTVSGDLHAIGIGTILRAGTINLEQTPITAVLAGPIGTAPSGWPSAFRGIGSTPPAYLDVREEIKPIEQHSFTMADFLVDRIILRFFKWDLKSQSPDAIDTLEPFHTTELERSV